MVDDDWLDVHEGEEDVATPRRSRLPSINPPGSGRPPKGAVVRRKESVFDVIEKPRKAPRNPVPYADPDKPLNRREEKLLRLMVEHDGLLTRSEMARRAGYSKKSATSIVATKLNPHYNPHFVRALRAAKAEIDEMYAVSRERTMKDLHRIREQAIKAGNFSAAVAAEKQRGMASEQPIYVERKEVRTGSLDSMSREQVEEELERLKREYGMRNIIIEGESTPVDDPDAVVIPAQGERFGARATRTAAQEFLERGEGEGTAFGENGSESDSEPSGGGSEDDWLEI